MKCVVGWTSSNKFSMQLWLNSSSHIFLFLSVALLPVRDIQIILHSFINCLRLTYQLTLRLNYSPPQCAQCPAKLSPAFFVLKECINNVPCVSRMPSLGLFSDWLFMTHCSSILAMDRWRSTCSLPTLRWVVGPMSNECNAWANYLLN